MKLATFDINSSGKRTIGVCHNGAYVDLVARSGGTLPADMIKFLKGGQAAMDQARNLLAGVEGGAGQHVYAEDEITLQSPVPLPGKIVHTSCNFGSHLQELTTWKDPVWEAHNWSDFHFEHPTGFLEAPSSVVPSGAQVEIPVFTRQLDYEIEIAIIIGKEAYRVGAEQAFDYVAGYTIFNDLSARDIQAREHSNKVILMGKSFKGSCPLGPWLVTLDELDDPHDLDMKLRVNGIVRQDSNTGQMHYKTAELVSWWSHMGLYPGDVITSGSPPGVAAGMAEPKWLQPGDTVAATIARLGTLTTRII
ncbi:MAG: fumarylacetoacetate hydrolase family protein [Gammaproteobacteria bacterium]|nr:fumarylacetoacetate hydrolase family protein [Gammaproteobacteria bacterium]MCY4209861.1 fumarylacetoacetate hydrolase family protein [Gammaproteobacteria bacterium]MCY4282541.1 fumarylacetoacetate hydrolase family protein [Gammaproteobacteria bacterium]MCY4339221.1 fumarylacetoacetate hydrolase family protein [Gammaproteobacteria bacterium]